MSWEFWYLFPISIGIAAVAMSSGIGGAVFFSPIFLLWLKLEPSIAIGTALLTELFGFGSGLVAYLHSKRIDFKLAGNLLVFSIPSAVVGVLLSDHFPALILKAIFATGLLFLGYQLFAAWQVDRKEKSHESTGEAPSPHETRLVDRDGTLFEYTVRNKTVGRVFAAIGGMFVGMISVGLAELEEYELVVRCKVPPPVAVATSIFVVVCTVFVAVVGHAYTFFSHADDASIQKVLSVAVFTVPGVLIGGQIGPRVGGHLSPDLLKVVISMLFMAVGVLMLVTLAM